MSRASTCGSRVARRPGFAEALLHLPGVLQHQLGLRRVGVAQHVEEERGRPADAYRVFQLVEQEGEHVERGGHLVGQVGERHSQEVRKISVAFGTARHELLEAIETS